MKLETPTQRVEEVVELRAKNASRKFQNLISDTPIPETRDPKPGG
jgi:hypothetical protein